MATIKKGNKRMDDRIIVEHNMKRLIQNTFRALRIHSGYYAERQEYLYSQSFASALMRAFLYF